MFCRTLFFRVMVAVLLGLTCCHRAAFALIIYESGSLRGLLGGSCPDCAYDNWISHISENIARDGYNDYGPVSLDPQLDGFGRYAPIVDSLGGQTTLINWYNIFAACFAADTHTVDSLLETTALDSIYDLIVFSDLDSARTYFILREHLDSLYYDEQQTPEDSSDDVWGSFDCGWGIYIFAPDALHPELLVEVPHPEDDFITPWVATDIFELWHAGCLMIAGAGREVLWTEQGNYDNTKSLSDPTRISNTVFHVAHRAFCDLRPNDFALQLHSYDTETHPNRKSLVISAGADDGFPNEPVLDRCSFNDMISLTPPIPVPENTCGNHPDVSVGDYYALYYEGGYRYQGVNPQISTNNDLIGYGQNRQMQHSHAGHDRYRHNENFVHIELDELPDRLLDDAPTFYRTDLPGGVTFENYVNALNYYRPAFLAMAEAMDQTPVSDLLSPIPAALNFGNVQVPGSSIRSVLFTNISLSETLFVTGASVTGSPFDLIYDPGNIFLAPGEPCSLTVEFTPTHAQLYTGVLTLSTDDGCSHLDVRGTGGGSMLTLLQDSLAFGPVELGLSDTLGFQIRNTGNAPMTISEFLSSDSSAQILPPADSVVFLNQNEFLYIEFTPRQIPAVLCSVAVVNNSINNDTAWVTVTGSGTAIPQAVQGLVILRLDSSSVQLHWPRVDSTTIGFPLPADEYLIFGRQHFEDPVALLISTPDTTFTHTSVLDSLAQMYYEVIASYDTTAALPILRLKN